MPIEDLAREISDFLEGKITPEDFRKIRVLWGLHQQRQKEKYFLRVRIPGGRLEAKQLETLAEVTAEFSQRAAHVTTRQNFQIYFLNLQDIPKILRRLEEAGLGSRKSAGNTVRNITACPMAGVCPEEVFDVFPFVKSLSEKYLREGLSGRLPRKVKIALSGCERDCAMCAIHDIGAIATKEDGRTGFRILAGGGLGSLPRQAQRLEPFTEARHLMPTVEATLRLFDREGDRSSRARARLKFLVEKMGLPAFSRRALEVRNAILSEEQFAHGEENPVGLMNGHVEDPSYGIQTRLEGAYESERWRLTNVWSQRQRGFFMAVATLPLGDITPLQMRVLARVSRLYGQAEARTTAGQNILIPWISKESMESLHGRLKQADLAMPCSERACDITCCAGAETCPSAFTNSRALTAELIRFFQTPEGRILRENAGSLRIKISGCLNSCGQHRIADIGLGGRARKVMGTLCPMYSLYVGGFSGEGEARFGELIATVPAQRAALAVKSLLHFYIRFRRESEDFRIFAQRISPEVWRSAIVPFEFRENEVPSSEEKRDVGADEDYRVEVRAGEC